MDCRGRAQAEAMAKRVYEGSAAIAGQRMLPAGPLTGFEYLDCLDLEYVSRAAGSSALQAFIVIAPQYSLANVDPVG